MICTLCNSPLQDKIDIHYYKCKKCLAISKDKKYYLSQEEEKNRYKKHDNNVNDVKYQNFTSPITNFILKNYNKENKGLDFGCGSGPVISKMLKDNGYNIKQYDPIFYSAKEVLNFKYDYIVSCEVFEHFHESKKEIENLLNLLKKNGRLLIMTLLYNKEIDFKNWTYRRDPTHVFIFQKETFEYLAKTMNLKIEFLDNRFIVLKKLNLN